MPYIYENDDSRKAYKGIVAALRDFYHYLRNLVMGTPEPEKKKPEHVEIVLLLRDMARYARTTPNPRIEIDWAMYLQCLESPEINQNFRLNTPPHLIPCSDGMLFYVYGVPVYLKKAEQE